jgi:hypothetical protein
MWKEIDLDPPHSIYLYNLSICFIDSLYPFSLYEIIFSPLLSYYSCCRCSTDVDNSISTIKACREEGKKKKKEAPFA